MLSMCPWLRARRCSPKGKCVIGGYGKNNTDLLCTGTKEEIQAVVEKIVDEAGTTGASSAQTAPSILDTPYEHLHWVYEKAEEISDRLLRK